MRWCGGLWICEVRIFLAVRAGERPILQAWPNVFSDVGYSRWKTFVRNNGGGIGLWAYCKPMRQISENVEMSFSVIRTTVESCQQTCLYLGRAWNCPGTPALLTAHTSPSNLKYVTLSSLQTTLVGRVSLLRFVRCITFQHSRARSWLQRSYSYDAGRVRVVESVNFNFLVCPIIFMTYGYCAPSSQRPLPASGRFGPFVRTPIILLLVWAANINSEASQWSWLIIQ